MQVQCEGGKIGRARPSISLSRKIANGPPTNQPTRNCADRSERVLNSQTDQLQLQAASRTVCKAVPVAGRHFQQVANLWILFCSHHQHKRVPAGIANAVRCHSLLKCWSGRHNMQLFLIMKHFQKQCPQSACVVIMTAEGHKTWKYTTKLFYLRLKEIS